MMKSYFIVILFLASSIVFSSQEVLHNLLALKPGDKILKTIKTSESGKDFSYEIEKENGLIQSVKIEFTLPVSSDALIKGSMKGHCMVQKPAGDVVLNRFFFFDLKSKRRYELTIKKKIKSILIQDIPGAVENKPCTFAAFNLESKQ